jgi:hypothetical protein
MRWRLGRSWGSTAVASSLWISLQVNGIIPPASCSGLPAGRRASRPGTRRPAWPEQRAGTRSASGAPGAGPDRRRCVQSHALLSVLIRPVMLGHAITCGRTRTLRQSVRRVRWSSWSPVPGAGGISVILSLGVCADLRRVSSGTRLVVSFSRLSALSTAWCAARVEFSHGLGPSGCDTASPLRRSACTATRAADRCAELHGCNVLYRYRVFACCFMASPSIGRVRVQARSC